METGQPYKYMISNPIHTASGQLVSVLKDEYQQAGNYSVTRNAGQMSSGLYFCVVKANGITRVRKMTLIK